MVIQDPAQWKEDGMSVLAQQPIHIEIGSGKGQFVSGMARQNPNINYIGIEIQESVLVVALEKALAADVPNLQLLHVNGGQVTDYFEDGEVDQIYLNFSDPWPKKRHAKRRLTHESFLVGYEKFTHHLENYTSRQITVDCLNTACFILTIWTCVKQVWLGFTSSGISRKCDDRIRREILSKRSSDLSCGSGFSHKIEKLLNNLNNK